MRIIGGKDYYDSASAYGIDPAIVFVRDGRVLTQGDMDAIGNWLGVSVNLREMGDHHPRGYWGPRGVGITDLTGGQLGKAHYQLRSHPVIFCGKLYGGLEVLETSLDTQVSQRYWFWHMEKLERWATERQLTVGRGTYYWQRGNGNEDTFQPTPLGERTIQALAERQVSIAYQDSSLTTTSLHRGQTGWDLEPSQWIANGSHLRDMGFQSALDPVTAFQELSMWVGGVLGGARGGETVEIQDDLVRAHKAGFDTKTSFRRPKQGQ